MIKASTKIGKSENKVPKITKSCKAGKSVKSSKSSNCFQENPITQLNFDGVQHFESISKGIVGKLFLSLL